MEIKSLHRNDKTITILHKSLPIGLASEAHASCKLGKQEMPWLYYYGHEFTLTHTMESDDE